MKICDSDSFLDMPLSAQALYFHLNMRADDDGFIGNTKRIVRLIGANEDDYRILIMKRFLIEFDDGVIVIKHWRMHNTLSQNRYNETQYVEEKSMLRLKDNGSYSLREGRALDDSKMIEASNRQSSRLISVENKDTNMALYKSVIDCLNEKAGTRYRYSSKKTQTCIQARIKEGFTLEDFHTVIDKKCSEWIGTEFEKFLRPETLFGTKFESYLNAKIVRKQVQKSKFNNFESRQYDMKDLERKLLCARG